VVNVCIKKADNAHASPLATLQAGSQSGLVDFMTLQTSDSAPYKHRYIHTLLGSKSGAKSESASLPSGQEIPLACNTELSEVTATKKEL
jgi:hypothetical protein